jgi:hypothetical protein
VWRNERCSRLSEGEKLIRRGVDIEGLLVLTVVGPLEPGGSECRAELHQNHL